MPAKVLKLSELDPGDIPEQLKVDEYFDFQAHPFDHEALFKGAEAKSAYGVILAISDYAKGWLADTIARKKAEDDSLTVLTDEAPNAEAQTIGNFEVVLEAGAVFAPAMIVGGEGKGHTVYVESGARIVGSILYLDDGCIYVGSGTTMEPGLGIKGPTIIGKDCELRQGAYLRGNCILGDGCTIRGEMKNVVMMNKANFPHPSYVGDSLCGYMTHFGNQASTANLGIFEGLRDPDKRKPLVLTVDGVGYDLGKPKMGIVMGDFSQLGCNSVTDPGTFLRPYTIAYALTRLSKGFYGPNEILKNKPLEHGVIERAPMRPLD
ncbi:hypothetical protein LCGC14_2113480 [marine sediment metagenome]|uniref:Glucose-1-phosphate thymidylyltransferase n=1 Tax=marine sediment metagenome TaxID=412755 RepID=A0A0F9GJI7_9ZZZZ